ncbi:DUF4157 domain-containing protein [Methylicorpusculum sp.]|uniref:eCIS core domain-containing protein n=1 Tax=Methylicorpusculum sp. TaxID=2713644 RepID=UPI00271DAA6A|nr:DUF4157 domain-containing protein [Methylicorpusculum sp.]MDO8844128.1 DUF4157 domain-containing protein [Methylicorpusculum sp.]
MSNASTKKAASTSKAATPSVNQPFFAKSGSGGFFSPANEASIPSVQMKMTVNKPGDKFEQEADKMADKVMRMPAPEEKIQKAGLPEEKVQKQEDPKIQKAETKEEKVQKQEEKKIQKAAMPERQVQKKQDDKLQRKGGDGTPSVGGSVQSAIHSKTNGGQALSSDVRGYMEPRFGADFSNIRIHQDAEAAGLSQQLNARAFTYQNHVFFADGQYQPESSGGKQLLAHELTHTIQQGQAIQRSPQQSATTSPPAIQRLLGIDIPSWQDVIDWLAEKAYNIPGYRMFTIVIGVNPINGANADRSAANILRAVVEFLPGGKIITDALTKYGVFEKAGTWVEDRLKRFETLAESIGSAVSRFVDNLDFLDIVLHPVRTWEQAVDLFTTPVNNIIDFIGGIFQDILQFIRDAVLMPLAALAQGKPGFDLLCAILGKNPISNEPVPRNADTLIGGFMKLIGQEDVWENIKKGNAVQKAWKWFETALQELFAMVVQFPQDFIAMLKSLEVMDFIVLPNLFIKVFKVFGSFVVQFSSWAFGTILSLLEIIFSVVAPGVMPYVAKAKASFQKIIKDPIGFVGNLVKAGKMGFQLFMSRIGEHLKTALIKWITGPLGDAGVYIPKSFDLMEIVKLVLSVLGLTWQNIRGKLVKIIPDPVLAGLEKTAGILVTLVKEGPAVAWDQIKAELTELKGQLIAQVTQMITTEIVKAAITKLVMMLNPAGAFVQAVLAIWNTVSFFVQKIKQIGQAAAAFIDSISAIAAGQIAGAAQKVETTMARTLTVVIAFLAKFAGLGNIPEKIVGIVKKIRAPIDKGLDKIVGWLGGILKKLVSSAKGLAGSLFQWWKKKIAINTGAEPHSLYFKGEEDQAEPMVASSPRRLENFVAESRANTDVTGDPKKKAALDKIDSEIPVLRKIRADLRPLKDAPDDKRKPHLDKLDISFGKIGTELGVILADSKSGTEVTPIPIPWPKPAYTGYPPLFLFNQGEPDKPKWKLSAKMKAGKLVATYNPGGGHNLKAGPPVPPAELKSIGIKSSYQITPGKVIGPLSEVSTPGGGSLNSLLERFGWSASEEYMDADHVVEIQFGGKDVPQNLWPLDASVNRGAGSKLSKQQVNLDGQNVTIDWLKKVKKKPGEETKKYFFKVS